MRELPEEGYLRLRDIIGDRKSNPPVPGILPISRSAWYQGIREGRYPKPHKPTPRTSLWSVKKLRELLASINAGESANAEDSAGTR